MLPNDQEFKLAEREKEILEKISLKKCEFIVKIEEMFWENYGDDVKLCIVMEYYQVCFKNIIKSYFNMIREPVLFYSIQIHLFK